MSGEVLLIILTAVLFTAALAGGIIFLVLKLLAGGSGWSRLAERYGVDQPLPGMPITSGLTVIVGVVSYRRSMTVGVWPQGLYLSTRMARPAVLIPWSEFTGITTSTYYQRQVMRFNVGNPQLNQIAVFMDIYSAMKPYLPPEICQGY